MSAAVQGVNKIMLLRPLSQQENEAAKKMAFQTSHSVESSRSADSTATKDGYITSLGDESVGISLETIMAQTDNARVLFKAAYRAGEIVEFWDINKTEAAPSGTTDDDGNDVSGLFPATYYQGYLTDWGEDSSAEDAVTISISAQMNGSGVEGYATLTEEQKVVVQYKFVDTVAQGTGA